MRVIAQREDIRDLILDGVDTLLAKYGYKKMTMEDLAQTVGIGKGTIYLHFKSKEEAVLSHIDRIVVRLVEELKSITTSKDRADSKIRRMLVTRVLFRLDSVRNYSQSLNDLLSSLRPALITRRQKHFTWEAVLFREVLQSGKDEGFLQFRSADDIAEVLIGATNSFLPYSLSARELGKKKEIEAQVLQIADVLLHGLIRRN